MGISPETIYSLEKKVGGFVNSLKGPIEIKPSVGGASISEGIRLDKEENNWEGALSQFYTVYKNETKDAVERVEGAIWASQMLINSSRLNQAEKILDEAFGLTDKMSKEHARLSTASILEKRAWILDYRNDYSSELTCLSTVKEIYDSFAGRLPSKCEDSRSTAEHFSGRAKFGLAWQGKNKEKNLNEAMGYFKKDLNRYQELRSKGKPRPAGEGFNHLWLARCYGHKGEFYNAEASLEKSLQLFNEDVEHGGGSAVLAHYYLAAAELSILRGEPKAAVLAAEEALWIRMNHKPKFPKGEIEALLVLGLAYWQDGKLANALVFGGKAFEVAKHLLGK